LWQQEPWSQAETTMAIACIIRNRHATAQEHFGYRLLVAVRFGNALAL
jgi:hypothetical protein